MLQNYYFALLIENITSFIEYFYNLRSVAYG